MVKYLLDSNIVLGIVKGYSESSAILQGIELYQCAYSSVTRMELLGYTGITAHEIKIITSLLNHLALIQIDSLIENRTIAIKQQHKIKLPDAIILATALVNRLKLLTLDKRLANKFNLGGV